MDINYPASPTQIKLFNLCEKKYWFERVAQVLPRGDSHATKFGKECHDEWEYYLVHGPKPKPWTKAQKVVARIFHLLPLPGPWNIVEGKFIFEDPLLPLAVQGIIDLMIEDQGELEDGILPAEVKSLGPIKGVPLVQDHKTSKDPGTWAMSDEELSHDIQAIVYGYRAQQRFDSELVDVRWGYASKTKNEGVYSQYRFTADELHHKMYGEVAPILEKMIETRMKETQDECSMDLNGCGAFGGCPYRQFCNINDEDFSDYLTSELDMDLDF